MIQQLIDSFPYLQLRGYTIHLNHTSLMKGILLYCGLSEDQHSAVLAALTYKPKVGRDFYAYGIVSIVKSVESDAG